jgi:hypothetical protein
MLMNRPVSPNLDGPERGKIGGATKLSQMVELFALNPTIQLLIPST